MTIEKQKKLRFVPIVNFLTMFFWLGMCFEKAVRWIDFMKELVKIFAFGFLFALMRGVSAYFIQSEIGNRIAFFACVYMCLLAISWVSVGAQERILKRENDNKEHP